jgi:hypothetical protein
MSDCWAANIGGCSGGMSKEHIISKALFTSPMITVEGFPWCKGASRTVSLASLTAKNLCRSHNSGLSPLDQEASTLFGAIRNWCERENNPQNASPLIRLSRRPTMVRAKLLERWFLKSLINLSLSRDYIIGIDGAEKGEVPASITAVCFGEKDFEDGAGMYVAGRLGMLIASDDTVRFSPLLRENRVLGGLFEFRGFRFCLSLVPERLHTMPPLDGAGSEWDNASLSRPIEKIQIQIGGNITVPIIQFKW